LFERFCGKVFGAIARWMTQRFQQSLSDQHGNFIRVKAEKPRRLRGIKPGGNDFPTEKFGLLGGDIHT
jgi:hypothetical protein